MAIIRIGSEVLEVPDPVEEAAPEPAPEPKPVAKKTAHKPTAKELLTSPEIKLPEKVVLPE